MAEGRKKQKSPFKFLKGLNLKKIMGGKTKKKTASVKALDSSGKQPAQLSLAGGPANKRPSAIPQRRASSAELESTKKSLKKLISEMNDLKSKVGQIDSTLEVDKKFQKDITDKLNKLEKEIHELFSIYEMMTSTINPFIDTGTKNITPLPEGEAQLPQISGLESGATSSQEAPDFTIPPPETVSNENPFVPPPEPQNIEEKTEKEKPEENPFAMEKIGTTTEEPEVKEVRKKVVKEDETEDIESEENYILAHIDKKDPISVLVALKWLECMINRIGVVKLEELLQYYVSIGWISPTAKKTFLSYLRGIATREKVRLKGRHQLGVKDHLFSLYVIRKLAKQEQTTSLRVSILDEEYRSIIEEIESIGIDSIGVEDLWV